MLEKEISTVFQFAIWPKAAIGLSKTNLTSKFNKDIRTCICEKSSILIARLYLEISKILAYLHWMWIYKLAPSNTEKWTERFFNIRYMIHLKNIDSAPWCSLLFQKQTYATKAMYVYMSSRHTTAKNDDDDGDHGNEANPDSSCTLKHNKHH